MNSEEIRRALDSEMRRGLTIRSRWVLAYEREILAQMKEQTEILRGLALAITTWHDLKQILLQTFVRETIEGAK